MSMIDLIEGEDAARAYCTEWADKAGMDRLERFAALLLEENQQQNLISKPSESTIWQRHIADSIQLLRLVPRETLQDRSGVPWMDLGTGAGFPGIILAAVMPDTPMVLVESRTRRVEFLNRATETLGLPRCEVRGDRLERLEPFQTRVITARAFAPLEKLLRLSAPFSTKETRYLLPKGRSAAQELAGLKPRKRKMFHVEQSLTDREAGIIVSS